MKTRFARFQNIPELLGLYRQVADVRGSDDLALPTPEISGGKPETVTVPASDTLRAYVAKLAQRAQHINNRAVSPEEDNMLKVAGDGRRAALDLRLVGKPPDLDGGKIATVAARIAAIYHVHRDRPYSDAQGQPAPRAGVLQLVFCDVSTPSGGGWNAYDELRDQLIHRGVPAAQVRYVQHAQTEQAKADMFAGARDGQVAVLIGSTETMGVGSNVQARAIALHHLDRGNGLLRAVGFGVVGQDDPASRPAIRMAAACPIPELPPVTTAIFMLAASWLGMVGANHPKRAGCESEPVECTRLQGRPQRASASTPPRHGAAT